MKEEESIIKRINRENQVFRENQGEHEELCEELVFLPLTGHADNKHRYFFLTLLIHAQLNEKLRSSFSHGNK